MLVIYIFKIGRIHFIRASDVWRDMSKSKLKNAIHAYVCILGWGDVWTEAAHCIFQFFITAALYDSTHFPIKESLKWKSVQKSLRPGPDYLIYRFQFKKENVLFIRMNHDSRHPRSLSLSLVSCTLSTSLLEFFHNENISRGCKIRITIITEIFSLLWSGSVGLRGNCEMCTGGVFPSLE